MRTAAAGIRRIELKRQKHLDLIVRAWRKSKIARHHADNRCRLRIDLNLLADDVARAAEGALPKAVRNDGYIWPAVAILFRREVAALHGLHAKGIDQPARNCRRGHAQWFAIGAHILSSRGPGAYRLPGFRVFLNVEQLRWREPELSQLHRGKLAIDTHQLPGFAKRKRSQQD